MTNINPMLYDTAEFFRYGRVADIYGYTGGVATIDRVGDTTLISNQTGRIVQTAEGFRKLFPDGKIDRSEWDQHDWRDSDSSTFVVPPAHFIVTIQMMGDDEFTLPTRFNSLSLALSVAYARVNQMTIDTEWLSFTEEVQPYGR